MSSRMSAWLSVPLSVRVPAAAAALLAAAALAGCSAGATSHTRDDPKPPATAPGTATPKTSAPGTSTPGASSARDGRDYGACADGDCQILVDAPAAVPVRHRTLRVSVSGTTVRLSEAHGGSRTNMSMGGTGGHSVMRTDGETVDVAVDRVADGAAVLDITSP